MKIILSGFQRKGTPLSRVEEQSLLQKIIDLLCLEGLEFELKVEEVERSD